MNYREALKLATKKHKGQYRKNTREPYISHPLAVAKRFDDDDYKIVAVLHDTLEDTDLTVPELMRYNIKSELLNALMIITKSSFQTYLDFVLQVKKNKIATAVKIEDIKHNLSDLGNGNLREKYLMALYILQMDEI